MCLFRVCPDIDECSRGVHHCTVNQTCLNTIGNIDSHQCNSTVVGFECPCKQGYQPLSDGTDCVGEYNLDYNKKLPIVHKLHVIWHVTN